MGAVSTKKNTFKNEFEFQTNFPIKFMLLLKCWVYLHLRYRSSATSRVLASKHLLALEQSLIKGACHMFHARVFTLLIKEVWYAFYSCATPLLLAIILARANAYPRALATLRLSSTVSCTQQNQSPTCYVYANYTFCNSQHSIRVLFHYILRVKKHCMFFLGVYKGPLWWFTAFKPLKV